MARSKPPTGVVQEVHTVLKSEWDALLARVADLEAHTHETRMVEGTEGLLKVVTTRPVGFGSKPGSTGQRGE